MGGTPSTISFRYADTTDVEPIVRLVNAAFVVEHVFIDRDRTHPEAVRQLMQQGKFILAEDTDNLVGCVYVELHGDRGYLGLLSVDPQRQRSGLGRQIVQRAEEYFRESGCNFSDLRMVNLRTELAPFYRRLGYIENGRAPFLAGELPKVPTHFITMSKPLK